MNTDIQPRDKIGRINAFDRHLAVLILRWERLRSRDGKLTLCLSNHNFMMPDINILISKFCALCNIYIARDMYLE